MQERRFRVKCPICGMVSWDRQFFQKVLYPLMICQNKFYGDKGLTYEKLEDPILCEIVKKVLIAKAKMVLRAYDSAWDVKSFLFERSFPSKQETVVLPVLERNFRVSIHE